MHMRLRRRELKEGERGLLELLLQAVQTSHNILSDIVLFFFSEKILLDAQFSIVQERQLQKKKM